MKATFVFSINEMTSGNARLKMFVCALLNREYRFNVSYELKSSVTTRATVEAHVEYLDHYDDLMDIYNRVMDKDIEEIKRKVRM